jgi:hypothetical protein
MKNIKITEIWQQISDTLLVRVGIRERKALPLPPSHFQAQDTEFGDAIAAVLPVGNAVPVGKRQKTSAAAATKKPGELGLWLWRV